MSRPRLSVLQTFAIHSQEAKTFTHTHTHTHTITNCQQQLVFVFPSIQTSPLSQRTWLIFSALIHCAAAPRWLTDWLIHFTLSKTWIIQPQLDSARQPERADDWRKKTSGFSNTKTGDVRGSLSHQTEPTRTLTSQQINTGRHVGHQKPSPYFLLWRWLCQSVYCSLIETCFHPASWALITTEMRPWLKHGLKWQASHSTYS